jgi:transketolase
MVASRKRSAKGAGRIAGYLGLNNLIMFYDSNDIQLSTETNAVTKEDTAMKYKAWGWNVVTINGNDADEIVRPSSKPLPRPNAQQ